MHVLLFLMSVLVGLFGFWLLVTAPLQGIIGGVLLVLAGVLFSGAAVVDAVHSASRRIVEALRPRAPE